MKNKSDEILRFMEENKELNYTQVGAHFGLTKSAISGVVRRSKEKAEQKEFKKYDKIREVYEINGKKVALTSFQLSIFQKREAGVSLFKMAEELDVSLERVKWAVTTLIKLGVTKPKEIAPPKREPKIKEIKIKPAEIVEKKPEMKKSIALVEEPIVDIFTPKIERVYTGPKKLLDLNMSDCRWMISDDEYCAKHSEDLSKPWCAEHRKLVYLPFVKNPKRRNFKFRQVRQPLNGRAI